MIQINLLRISPDSEYIEFSIECPTNYRFNVLNIQKYDWETTTGYPANAYGWIDASSVYKKTSTKEIVRIATDIFKGSTMFILEFGVEWIGSEDEPLNIDGSKLSDQTTIGTCSDINNVYTYLLTSILSLDTCCPKISSDLKKMYIFLYAHIEAMKSGRIEDAKEFYEVLSSNLSRCNTAIRNNISYECGCNK